jgi:hypothetical protein
LEKDLSLNVEFYPPPKLLIRMVYEDSTGLMNVFMVFKEFGKYAIRSTPKSDGSYSTIYTKDIFELVDLILTYSESNHYAIICELGELSHHLEVFPKFSKGKAIFSVDYKYAIYFSNNFNENDIVEMIEFIVILSKNKEELSSEDKRIYHRGFLN